jgi:hypothetical protein
MTFQKSIKASVYFVCIKKNDWRGNEGMFTTSAGMMEEQNIKRFIPFDYVRI